MGLSVDLYEDLIQVPPLLVNLAHKTRTTHADLPSAQETKSIDPFAPALVADIDPALVQQVFNVAQR